MSSIFLATLGSEPQVVTISLQILLLQGQEIAEAIVVHTSEKVPAIGQALDDLRHAFAAPPFQGIPLHLHPISQGGLPLQDITTPEEAEATFKTLFDLIKALKKQGHRLLFCIAGGRKLMALYGLAVAQLLFDQEDALYYLFSENALVRERRLLLQPQDNATLICIPFLRWTENAILVADILRYDDPFEAMHRSSELAHLMEQQRWETFCQHVLTRAEEAVVALVVREGLTNAQIAQRLGRSPKTVANQLSNAYAKMADYLGDQGTMGVDRHTLITLLYDYYKQR